MKSLVQHRVLDESDISEMLKKLGDKRDYEWFEEDFMGSDLLSETILPAEMILEVAEPVFSEILHVKNQQ